ncbi:collagen alpha-1(I) chain-like [Harpia harpyja]|uniref:collagen alpha-1(I) chain-like n=1 Tax=Harpia harpyja TaxID=202280 RepID=UPI0022B1A8A1|nr:collagen alpha-1(I) chain-like [Harpia harpyja]
MGSSAGGTEPRRGGGQPRGRGRRAALAACRQAGENGEWALRAARGRCLQWDAGGECRRSASPEQGVCSRTRRPTPPPGPCWGGCTSGCGDTRGAAPTGKADAGDSPTVRGWVCVVREGGRRPLSPGGTAEGRHTTHTPTTPHPAPPRDLAQLPGASCGSFALPKSAVRGGVPGAEGAAVHPPRGRRERSRLRGGLSRHFQEDGATYGKHLELIGPAGAAPGSVVSPCGTVGTSPGRARRRPCRSPCPPLGTEPGPHRRAADGVRPLRSAGAAAVLQHCPPPRARLPPGGIPRRGGSAERVPQGTERCRGGSIPSPGGVRAAPGTQTWAGGWLDRRKTAGGRLRGGRRAAAGAHYGRGGSADRSAPAQSGARRPSRGETPALGDPPGPACPSCPPRHPLPAPSPRCPLPAAAVSGSAELPSTAPPAPPVPGEEAAAVPGALPGSAGPKPCPPGHAASPRQPWAPAPPEALGKPCPGLNSMSNTSTRKLPRAGIPELPGVGRSGPRGDTAARAPPESCPPGTGYPRAPDSGRPRGPAGSSPGGTGGMSGVGGARQRGVPRERGGKSGRPGPAGTDPTRDRSSGYGPVSGPALGPRGVGAGPAPAAPSRVGCRYRSPGPVAASLLRPSCSETKRQRAGGRACPPAPGRAGGRRGPPGAGGAAGSPGPRPLRRDSPAPARGAVNLPRGSSRLRSATGGGNRFPARLGNGTGPGETRSRTGRQGGSGTRGRAP